MATKRVNIDIVAKDKSQQALNKVRGNLDGVKKAVFNVRNALAGLGAGLVIRNLVNTGKEIESLQVRLKFLFGTAEEGAKAFDNMAKFAAKVPFSLEQIQQGAGVLSVVSKDADELSDILEITGNVAAVTGLDFRTASEQIQRSLSAGIASADLFREKGVRDLLGFKAGATVTAEETAEAFERVFGKGGKFGGATNELAQTLEGTLSMIGDKFFTFKKTILEAGFFPELKKQFKDLDDFLQNNTKTLDELAIKIGKGLAVAVRGTADAVKFLKDNFDSVVLVIQTMIGLKVASVFYGMTTALVGLTTAMTGFNLATKRNIIFGSIMVFASAMGFLIHKFKEFKGELETTEYDDSLKGLKKQLKEIQATIKENVALQKDGTEKHQDLLIMEEILLEEIEDKLIDIRIESSKAYAQMKDSMTLANKEIKKENNLLAEANEHMRVKNRLTAEQAGLFDLDKIVAELKKEQEEIEKKEDEVRKILEANKQKSIQIFYDMQAEKERINNSAKVKEINDEIAHAKNLQEIQKNNFHKMKDDALDFEHKKAQIRKQAKDHTISETRDTLEILSGMNRTAFQAFKAVRIAEAIVDTHRAAVAAFKNFGGFPFGAIAAAATVAKGMAMVAQIRSTNYRAGGGSVNKDQAYMVGEKGAEMFVPSGSGKIVPNHQLSNGKPVTVNFNINTVDARGFNELLVNSRGVIINMINSAVNEKGKMAIV